MSDTTRLHTDARRVVLALFRLPSTLAVGLALVNPAAAAQGWFVTTSGNDAHDCLTPDTACETIQAAVEKASFGDTVHVRAGIYTGSGSEVVLIEEDLALVGGWNETFTWQTGSTTVDGEGARQGLVLGFGTPTVSLDRFVVRNAVGGGVSNSGTLTMTRCTVENNEGGGIWNDMTLVVDASTISGNTSGGNGGGIQNHFIHSIVILNNSTVSGNHANSEGGGISVGGGFVSLNNSTITNNSADFGGGGVRNRTAGTLELQNTIIAGNTAPFGPDCWDPVVASFVSRGHNLIGNGTLCDFTPGPNDLVDVAPALGPLLDNGGPTRTHRPLTSSPAIDAGNPGGCTDADGAPLVGDQRGVARPQGGRCDAGAVEARRLSLKVNGADAIYTEFLTAANPVHLTIDMASSPDVLDHYYYWWVGGSFYWFTSEGVRTAPAPLGSAALVDLVDFELFSGDLPIETWVFGWFTLGGATVVDSDFVVAVVEPPCESEPPATAIVQPSTGSLPGTSTTIVANASDSGSGIEEVRFYYQYCPASHGFVCEPMELIGVQTTPTVPGGNLYESQWSFPNCTFENEKWRVVVRAIDNCGNESASSVDDLKLEGRGC